MAARGDGTIRSNNNKHSNYIVSSDQPQTVPLSSDEGCIAQHKPTHATIRLVTCAMMLPEIIPPVSDNSRTIWTFLHPSAPLSLQFSTSSQPVFKNPREISVSLGGFTLPLMRHKRIRGTVPRTHAPLDLIYRTITSPSPGLRSSSTRVPSSPLCHVVLCDWGF
jgi:hypothetical protein